MINPSDVGFLPPGQAKVSNVLQCQPIFLHSFFLFPPQVKIYIWGGGHIITQQSNAKYSEITRCFLPRYLDKAFRWYDELHWIQDFMLKWNANVVVSEVGCVPYSLLKNSLVHATPQQLYKIEKANPVSWPHLEKRRISYWLSYATGHRCRIRW